MLHRHSPLPTVAVHTVIEPRPKGAAIIDKMGKYYPLERYLSALDERTAAIGFSQIEAIIGVRLPQSAHKYRAWWGNDRRHVHAVAWMSAGWHVDTVDPTSGLVQFRR